jgi:hypothetical protein
LLPRSTKACESHVYAWLPPSAQRGRSRTRDFRTSLRIQPVTNELAHLALQHYSKCGGTRYNSRTCQVDKESSSELDKSTIYIRLLFDSDEDRVE